jgi:tetratricopeptide (TPR) repeat protein
MRPAITLIGRPPIATTNSSSFDWSPRRALEAPDPATVGAMHKELGIRYYNIREYNAALAELQKAARLMPGDKDIYYFLGGTYSGLGQPLKAFDNYKRCDGGTYANVAQNGAKKMEKAARKEYQQQQEQQYKNVPQTEAAAKNTVPNSALQNLSTPIISPLGGRAAFNNAPDK